LLAICSFLVIFTVGFPFSGSRPVKYISSTCNDNEEILLSVVRYVHAMNMGIKECLRSAGSKTG
jgi:hypothetical protein